MDPTTIATPETTRMILDAINQIKGGQYALVAVPVLWGLVAAIKAGWSRWSGNEKIKPWLPLVALVAGAAAGGATALSAGAVPAAVIAAVVAGAASGLGASGMNEIISKLWLAVSKSKKEEIKFLDEAKLRYRSGSLALDSSGNIKVN